MKEISLELLRHLERRLIRNMNSHKLLVKVATVASQEEFVEKLEEK